VEPIKGRFGCAIEFAEAFLSPVSWSWGNSLIDVPAGIIHGAGCETPRPPGITIASWQALGNSFIGVSIGTEGQTACRVRLRATAVRE